LVLTVGRSGRLHVLTNLSNLSFVWVSLRIPHCKHKDFFTSRFLPGQFGCGFRCQMDPLSSGCTRQGCQNQLFPSVAVVRRNFICSGSTFPWKGKNKRDLQLTAREEKDQLAADITIPKPPISSQSTPFLVHLSSGPSLILSMFHVTRNE
jgi:hypothetical protein